MGKSATPLAPTLSFAPELLLRAQDVRGLILAVDGVLTDGGLYFSGAGEVLRRLDEQDGLGLKTLQQIGVPVMVISGCDGAALRARLGELGIVHLHLGAEDKLAAAEALLAQCSLTWGEIAAMGADWPDLPLLRRVRFACVPVRAHAEVRAAAHHVTTAAGGQGAVRELCDLLLVATGHYARLLAQVP